MRWEDVFGFSKGEMEHYQEVVESTAHLMLEFAETGGLLNASGFLRPVRIGFTSGRTRVVRLLLRR